MRTTPRILCVDDEPIVQQTLQALLGAEGYELHFAPNGEEGLSMAASIKPDVILLDVMLPGKDGMTVCRELRSSTDLAEVPVLMITSLDDRATRLAGLDAGADDFITKPFDSLELLTRLRTITRLNRYRSIQEQRDQLLQMNQELNSAYDQTIEGWSQALDLRDRETEGHAQRVTGMSVRLARHLGMGEKQVGHIRRGAILHDIGKMGVPDAILLKPGPLTGKEWVLMRKHPVYAYEWLSPIEYLRPALDIPYCHHERWNGTGYPRGLEGLEIPMPARLFAIVDVWDAMNSHRPYREALPAPEVMHYIQSNRGVLFDPDLVQAFMECRDAKPIIPYTPG